MKPDRLSGMRWEGRAEQIMMEGQLTKKTIGKTHMEMYYYRNFINEHKLIEREFKLDYPVT